MVQSTDQPIGGRRRVKSATTLFYLLSLSLFLLLGFFSYGSLGLPVIKISLMIHPVGLYAAVTLWIGLLPAFFIIFDNVSGFSFYLE